MIPDPDSLFGLISTIVLGLGLVAVAAMIVLGFDLPTLDKESDE